LFDNWLAGERARFARWRRLALDRVATLLPDESDELIEVLRERVALAPHACETHLDLVRALTRHGLKAEAEATRATGIRLFENDGLDTGPLRKKADRSDLKSEKRQAEPSSTIPAAAKAEDPERAFPVAAVSGAQRRASIVIMPFGADLASDIEIANGLTHDITFGLAKLRSLMVIARGTAFALKARALSPNEAGVLLGVDYVASGAIRRDGPGLRIAIELAATESGRIVWADEFSISAQDMLSLLAPITTRIVSALDFEIRSCSAFTPRTHSAACVWGKRRRRPPMRARWRSSPTRTCTRTRSLRSPWRRQAICRRRSPKLC
jgi:TolB-like protein